MKKLLQVTNPMECRLNEVIVSITNRCNLRCAMCQIPGGDPKDALGTSEMKALIADAAALCPRSIVFSGGEPLLRDDIFDLIAFVNAQKINTCMASNGTLLTDAVAHRLSLAGIGVVNISIEGDEEAHDALRGKGNYAKAVAALGHLAKYKIETTIASIVSRQNYKTLPKVMELAHQWGVTTVKLQPFSDIFVKDKNIRERFFAPPELLADIRRSIAEAARLAGEYRIMTNPPEYLDNIPAYLCGECVINVQQKGCPAIFTSCPVTAAGDVLPCWVLSDRIIGNVKGKKLSAIWGSHRHDQLRRNIQTKGCGGCMMSCYDQNFGKPSIAPLMALKAQKLGRGDFYKRMYNRAYQGGRYVFAKAVNKIRVWWLVHRGTGSVGQTSLLSEIQAAKRALRHKRAALDTPRPRVSGNG